MAKSSQSGHPTLTLCVAAVSTKQGGTLYAKAKGPFHAEKTGEVGSSGWS
ncbi:MAG: hypothetical protein U0787_03270 [Polyangia bacterium]